MGTAKSINWAFYGDLLDASEAYWFAQEQSSACSMAPVPTEWQVSPAIHLSHAVHTSSANLKPVLHAHALPQRSPMSGDLPGTPTVAAALQGISSLPAAHYEWSPCQAPITTLPQDTVIVWDWDDTLMCSSAINAFQLQGFQAAQLEALLEQVLIKSMKLGKTIIITNADELWVLESTRRFAPRVLPLLNQVGVVSARRKYECAWPGDVYAWKRETFREVLAMQRTTQSFNGPVNLVVLGDSNAEIEAAHTATQGAARHYIIKTVKFKEVPSVEELLQQLRVVVQDLSMIVADEKSSARSLAQWIRPQPLMSLPAASMLAATVSPTFAYSTPLVSSAYATSTSTCISSPLVYAAGQ